MKDQLSSQTISTTCPVIMFILQNKIITISSNVDLCLSGNRIRLIVGNFECESQPRKHLNSEF